MRRGVGGRVIEDSCLFRSLREQQHGASASAGNMLSTLQSRWDRTLVDCSACSLSHTRAKVPPERGMGLQARGRVLPPRIFHMYKSSVPDAGVSVGAGATPILDLQADPPIILAPNGTRVRVNDTRDETSQAAYDNNLGSSRKG